MPVISNAASNTHTHHVRAPVTLVSGAVRADLERVEERVLPGRALEGSG